ncbi:MAG TPA: hypothetical protein VF353_07740 [Candidatus Binatia bacterium]
MAILRRLSSIALVQRHLDELKDKFNRSAFELTIDSHKVVYHRSLSLG